MSIYIYYVKKYSRSFGIFAVHQKVGLIKFYDVDDDGGKYTSIYMLHMCMRVCSFRARISFRAVVRDSLVKILMNQFSILTSIHRLINRHKLNVFVLHEKPQK